MLYRENYEKEKPFNKGDTVSYGSFKGTITKKKYKKIYVEDLDGRVFLDIQNYYNIYTSIGFEIAFILDNIKHQKLISTKIVLIEKIYKKCL
jgi:hypothetical protein